MKKIILLFLGLYFFSCSDKNSYVDDKNSYVDKARVIIKNNKNLDEVTNFYEKSPEKLKAAYILISNLEKGKSGFENTSMNKSFDLIVPVIKEKGKTPEVFELFNKYLDSLTHSRGNREYKRDVEIMDSDMLIDNIELAYRAVENLPKNLKPNEKAFLDYVLPYKNGFEPLEPNLRKNLLKEYGWIHSVIRKNNSLESGVCALLDTLNLKLSPNPLYSGTPTISQINKIKFGICSDLVSLVVHILRALGIPATSDFTVHWGNHYSMGHEWLVFFSKENEYAIDVYDYRQLNNI